MRVVGILAVYNERRFLRACIENLLRQGVEAWVIDNGSTDGTREIAEQFLGHGVAGIEDLPRHGVYEWRKILERKEQLASSLDADWVIHLDADEIRLGPSSATTLAEALAEAEGDGFNAVNFMEFTFVPVREHPDHDHAEFQRTMRWYYPFSPAFPHRLNAWKPHPKAEIAWSGGHLVRFPGIAVSPVVFKMRHYLYLSADHIVEKYVARTYDREEVQLGWHGWRASLTSDMVDLPRAEELRFYADDDALDSSNPRTRHYLQDVWAEKRSVKE